MPVDGDTTAVVLLSVDLAGVVGTVALMAAVVVDGIVVMGVSVKVGIAGLAFVELVCFFVFVAIFIGDNMVDNNANENAEDDGDT